MNRQTRIHRIAASLTAALLILPALPALATAATELPPEGSEPKAFSLPPITSYALNNGLKVTLVPYGIVPKATVHVVTRVGNLNDNDTPWISDLTADMMGEGAAGKTAAQIARSAAEMGGDLNIGTGLDTTGATMDVLADSAADAIALIADVLQRPDFPASEYDRILQDRLRNLSVGRSQPQPVASDAFIRQLYPAHPYADAALPSEEAVAAITLADIRRFHAAEFGARRTHVYVVGQFDAAEVREAIKTNFAKWAPGPAPLNRPPAGSFQPGVVLIDRPGAVQSTLRFGKRVPPLDGSVDLQAANTLLGGYFSSRITRNIREDKGYTYSPRSAISHEVGAAYWSQAADVTSEATGASMVEIIKEIQGLIDQTPPADEVRGVKNYMNGVFVIRLASRRGMAGQLSFVNLHDVGVEYLENYVSAVGALTPADIQAAARKHLNPDEMTLVVVGDEAFVRSQLESLPVHGERLPAAN